MKLRISILLIMLVSFSLVVGGCGKPKDPENPQEMKEKFATKVNYMMWKVDATKEQKEKMDKLLDGLSVDLFNFQEEDKKIKRGLIDAFHADPLNQEYLDALQVKGLDLFDRFTKRMMKAAVDTAAILNVEQRRELVDLWREWEFGD